MTMWYVRGLKFFLNVFSILTFLLLSVFVGYSVSYNISGCSILNVSGAMYYLNQSILNSSTPYCINISGDNIVLDCQGHTINGNGTASYGIYIMRASAYSTNITVENCTLSNWNSANIYVENANNNTFSNIISTNSSGLGMYFKYCSLLNISNSHVFSNAFGIEIFGKTTGDVFLNINNSHNTYTDFNINDSLSTDLITNTLFQNIYSGYSTNYGFNFNRGLGGGFNVTFVNVTSEQHNGSLGEGIRINNAYVSGGLYYYNFTFINCTFRENSVYDFDFFACSKGYPGSKDFFLKNVIGSGGSPILFLRNQTILQNLKLSELILCDADYSNLDNITVTGSSVYNNNGVRVVFTDYSNFSNINSSNNQFGFYFYNSSSDSLSNIISNGNSQSGLLLSFFSSGLLSGVSSSYNGYSGIFINKGGRNNLTNSYLTLNDYGLYLNNSDANNVFNLTSKSNLANGVTLFQSSNNTINGLDGQYNSKIGVALKYSLDNNLSNMNLNYSGGSGMYITSSNYTKVFNLSVSYDGGTGLYIYYSNFNTMNYVKANHGSGDGIVLYHSNFNIINNSEGNFDNPGNYGVGLGIRRSNYNIINNCTAIGDFFCIFSWYDWSSDAGPSEYNNITNTLVKGCPWDGMQIPEFKYNTIKNCNVTLNGVYGGKGIYLGSYNKLINNTIKGNYKTDLFVSGSGNLIYGNHFSSRYRVNPGTGINYWNTSYSNGGGNHWDAYDSPAGGCYDLNGDGFCDAPYNISTTAKDYLPIFVNRTQKNFTCYNCSQCSYIIQNNASYYDVVYLGTDILNSSVSYCINFGTAKKDGVTFDCKGHVIEGNGIATYGITIDSDYNNNVRNCILKDWAGANIRLLNIMYSSFMNIISNNSISTLYVPGIGLLMICSYNDSIRNVTLKENQGNDLIIRPYSSTPVWFGAQFCKNTVINATGSGDRPIIYANSPVNINNKVLSELILCGASYSNITNVSIQGSDSLNNNGVYVYTTWYSVFDKVNSSHNHYGFFLASKTNNTCIKNSIANYNPKGFETDSAMRTLFYNVTAEHNTYGFYAAGMPNNNNKINNSIISYNSKGIYFGEWSLISYTVFNTTISNNQYGLYLLSGSNWIKVIHSYIVNNSGYGVIDNSNYVSHYYDNIFDNYVNFVSSSYHPILNTTKSPGPNIITGPYLGGNFWAKPNGSGYSQTCYDLNGDGFCDVPYKLAPLYNMTDYLPLTSPGPYYVLPTPLNNTKISRPYIFYNVNLKNHTPTSCILYINGKNYTMFQNLTNCYYNFTSLPGSVTQYTFNVSYNLSGIIFKLGTRRFTYYPYIKRGVMGVAPFATLLSLLLSIVLIYII